MSANCRVPLVADADISPELMAAMRSRLGTRPIPNVYRALANAPAMLQAWLDMAWPIRNHATSPRRVRELAILRVAQLADAPYEWAHHVVMAADAGVTQDQIDAVAEWRTASVFSDVERATLRVSEELTVHGGASGEATAELQALVGNAETVEIVLTASFYNCVARVLNTLAVPEE